MIDAEQIGDGDEGRNADGVGAGDWDGDGDGDGEIVVDVRGRRCPIPVIELARHIGDVEVGGVVELWADDPAAGPDVRAWCRMRDQDLVDDVRLPDGTGSSYRIRRRT